QSRWVAQAFAPVDGAKNGRDLLSALDARLLDRFQERINACVGQHLLPADIPSLEKVATTHVRKIIPVLGDQSGTVSGRVVTRQVAEQHFYQVVVVGAALREREA